MSLRSEVQRILRGKESLKTGLNEMLPDGHKISNSEKLDEYASHLEHIETGSGGGGSITIDVNINGSSAIICAELPNTTLKLYNSSEILLDTHSTGVAGGLVTFSVASNGTYTIKAFDSDNTEIWTNTVIVDRVGTYNCKTGKPLNDYTWAEINTASTGGYAKYMWSVGDAKKIVQSGSIFNNYDVLIASFNHHTLASDGVSKAGITFMFKKYYSGSSYNINPSIYRLQNATATAFTSTSSNKGGYKYCIMRQKFQQTGQEVWSQAQSLKPDDSVIVEGIPFSSLYYTNGNGEKSKVYSFDETTDTMTELNEFAYTSNYMSYFVKGYFKSVGKINEETFDSGYYYTYANNVYTPATEYNSNTTYYGFYKTLQEDGVFCVALSSIMQYIKPVKISASAGYQKTNNLETNEKVFLPCIEEVFGINRSSVLDSGSSGTSANAYNTAGEGTIFDYFKNNYQHGKIALGNTWWTRSPYTYNYSYFNTVNFNGYINLTNVYNYNIVRPCFCI